MPRTARARRLPNLVGQVAADPGTAVRSWSPRSPDRRSDRLVPDLVDATGRGGLEDPCPSPATVASWPRTHVVGSASRSG